MRKSILGGFVGTVRFGLWVGDCRLGVIRGNLMEMEMLLGRILCKGYSNFLKNLLNFCIRRQKYDQVLKLIDIHTHIIDHAYPLQISKPINQVDNDNDIDIDIDIDIDNDNDIDIDIDINIIRLMDQIQNQKYQKVYELINLPNTRPLDLTNNDPNLRQQIFKPKQLTKQQSKHTPQNLIKTLNQLLQQTQTQLQIYTQTSYNFKFPPSKFPDVPVGQRNNISYEQKVYVEDQDTFERKLSKEQVEQIRDRGEFQVRSKSYNTGVPYVWKINGCILRGRVKRALIWQNGLAWCYRIFDDALINLRQTVPENLKKLVYLPVRFFALIFGKKQMTLHSSPNYQRQVYKDFWTDIMQNQLKDINQQIGHQFLQQLYLYYNEQLYKPEYKNDQKHPYPNQIVLLQPQPNLQPHPSSQSHRQQIQQQHSLKKTKINSLKSAIQQLQQKFQTNWLKIRKKVLNKVSNEVTGQHSNNQVLMSMSYEEHPLNKQPNIVNQNKQDGVIVKKMFQEKFAIYTAHLRENLPKIDISKNVLEAIMNLVMIVNVIEIKKRVKNQQLQRINKGIRDSIAKKYPIRGKNYNFTQRKFKQQYQPIKNRIQNQFLQDLSSQLRIKGYFTQTYQSILSKYINLHKNFQSLIAQKQQTLHSLYRPSRIFRTTYILFPPYQVIQHKNTYSSNNGSTYTLKRKQEMSIDTGTHFWKCVLYGMRFKSWSLNCFKFLVGFCWAGPFGVRCLFGYANFAYDEQCDYSTGVKKQITRPPVLGVFGKVLRGLKKSRARFQALPDKGLFGKTCTRVFNLIQCYIFRLIFVGIIGVLCIYPIAIILISLISFIGVLTFWIWVPLAMTLCYIFNILVFQFQVGNRDSQSGCLIRSVPLISLLIRILVYLFRIVGSVLLVVLIVPIVCFFYFLFLVLQRGMRTITDSIMACIIGCLGRTPSRDTAIAKKISGPGMSRNHFYSIAEQDVYILTQSSLQQILLNKFAELTRTQIQKPLKKYTTITSTLLSPFGHTSPNLPSNSDLITKNVNSLLTSFNKRLENYRARYPANPRGVRFTQEELELYFENCGKIVRNFVGKAGMENWVFEEKKILNGDYEELTRLIWLEIFNCGEEIFQPLQQIDSRFKLVDQDTPNTNQAQMQKNITSIMKALQGEIELSQKKVNFTPAKRSLLDKDTPISYLWILCSMHSNNSDTNIHVGGMGEGVGPEPECLLVPHRNLGELREYDRWVEEGRGRGVVGIVEI